MPLTESLVDDFAAGVVDTAKWPANYGGTSQVGGRGRIACDTGYNAFKSALAYQLTGSSMTFQMFPPAAGGAAIEVWIEGKFEHPTTAGTAIVINVDAFAGVVRSSAQVGYGDVAAVQEPYSATLHAWLRVREASGTVHWERSADGVAWFTMRSAPTPAWLAATTTGNLLFQSHRDSGVNDYAEIDNVNNAPVAVTGQFTSADVAAARLVPATATAGSTSTVRP